MLIFQVSLSFQQLLSVVVLGSAAVAGFAYSTTNNLDSDLDGLQLDLLAIEDARDQRLQEMLRQTDKINNQLSSKY